MLGVTPPRGPCCRLSGPLHCPENQGPGGEGGRAAGFQKQVLRGSLCPEVLI